MKKYILLLLLLGIATGAYFWTASSGPEEIKVLATATVERAEVRQILEATGIVKAQVGAQVKIGARATGVLVNIPVKVGDRVSKGDLVAEIDDREVRARIAQAKARWKLAKAKADRAGKDLSRKRKLVRQNMEHQSALDEAVENARVTRYEAEAAKATIDSLEVELSYHRIYSPIDGLVSLIASQEGETVVSGLQVSNLITVLDPTRLEMWIYVDETDVGRTHEDLEVEFFVDAYPDTTFSGTIQRMYPEPEIRDNIVYYRALVGVVFDESTPLRPEMTTQCRIIVERKDNVLTLPGQAVKWVNGQQVVYLVNSDSDSEQVTAVSPKLGLQGLDRSEVLSGLAEGDTVATQLVLPGSGADKGKGK